ncbi:MAG TPA: PASTA domain-containing protein [Longimicrobiales bacterium]|nr:PASTA domain-containing protein [Longimicrobiales bacterium]
MSPVMTDSLRRRKRPRGSAGSGRRSVARSGSGIRWGRWLAWITGLSAIAFGAGWAVAVFVIFPPPPPPGDMVAVPDLVGRQLAEAERLVAEAGLGIEATDELPHGTQARGVVLAQSPLGGQRLRPGSAVRLAVSSGPRRARVPDLVGLPASAAVPLLTRAGFDVIVEREYVPGAQLGQVLRSIPAPGGEFTLPVEVTLTVTADSMTVLLESLGLSIDALGRIVDSLGRPIDSAGYPLDSIGFPLDSLGIFMPGDSLLPGESGGELPDAEDSTGDFASPPSGPAGGQDPVDSP